MSPVWKFQLRQSNVFLAEELPILYRDEHIVVIDKPPALLVHRSEIDRHETRFAIQILRDQIGQYVWPAHRLDRGTSGVLLFGLSKEIASQLGQQFEQGTVDKRYWADTRRHQAASSMRCLGNAIPTNSGENKAAQSRNQPSRTFGNWLKSNFPLRWTATQPAVMRYLNWNL